MLSLLGLLASIGLAGCGTTGRTSPFTLDLDLPRGQKITTDIRIASAAIDPNASIFKAINVRPWGAFEPDDLKNIEQSLRDTMAPHVPAAVRSGGPRLDVHLMIRRYMVSVSNTGGAVLASVTWAATASDGKLVFQEQFFASDSVHFVGTIGQLKESVHRAVVRRIAATSLALATAPDGMGAQPGNFENTYPSLEAAAERLPQTMVSMGIPGLMAVPIPVVSAVGLLTPNGISQVQWTAANPSSDFDWQGYLAKLYPKQ